MSGVHRTRFLLIVAMSLVLLAFILTLLFAGEWGLSRVSIGGGVRLKSGDILIHDQESIWVLDRTGTSLKLLADLTEYELTIGGDVRVSPQHDYIYMTACDISERVPVEGLLLLRYQLSNGRIQTVADMPGLARISPISPDGERVVLYVSPSLSDPTTAYYCLLEIEKGDCTPLDYKGIDVNEPIWLSDTTLITMGIDSLDVLSFESDGLSADSYFETQNLSSWYYDADIDPEGNLILAASLLGEDDYELVLLSLDLDSFEMSELPITPTEYHAAFNSVSVSPTGRYVAYQRWLRLEVQDLETGGVATMLDEALYSAWLPNDEKLVVYYDADPSQTYDYELVTLDVATGELQTIFRPDNQVYIVTVP